MLNNMFEIGEELHKNKEILRIRFCTKTSTNVPNEAIIIIVFIFRIKSDETVLLSMPTEVKRDFVLVQSLEFHFRSLAFISQKIFKNKNKLQDKKNPFIRSTS